MPFRSTSGERTRRQSDLAGTEAPRHLGGPGGTWEDPGAPGRVLSTPEMATATFGLRAPVAIEVVTAFAVSWKPLVKSNPSAVMTTTTTRRDDYNNDKKGVVHMVLMAGADGLVVPKDLVPVPGGEIRPIAMNSW
jgi:hypothetical protein